MKSVIYRLMAVPVLGLGMVVLGFLIPLLLLALELEVVGRMRLLADAEPLREWRGVELLEEVPDEQAEAPAEDDDDDDEAAKLNAEEDDEAAADDAVGVQSIASLVFAVNFLGFASSTWDTWAAKRSVHRDSLQLDRDGFRLMIIAVLPSPERQD